MVKYKNIEGVVHSITGDTIVLPELTTIQRDSLTGIEEGSLINHNGILERRRGGAWRVVPDDIPFVNEEQFSLDSLGKTIIKKAFPQRIGQINFNRPGAYGSVSDPLLDMDDVNLSIGEDDNEIIVYLSMGTIPQFITDLGLAGSFSTAPTDVNRIKLTKISSDTTDGTLKVFTRGDSLGEFIYLMFEDIVDPVPATLTDSGSPGITVDLDDTGGVTYNLGAVKQSIGLGGGSFLTLNRSNSPVATFLNNFTIGFGISFWAKIPTTANPSTRTIYSTNGDFDGTGVRVSTTSGGQVQFYVKATTSLASAQRIITGSGDLITNDGIWSHWVISWRQSDGQALIWKNGVLLSLASSTIVADTAVSSNNGLINRSQTGNTSETWYDDMRIRPTYFTQVEVDNLFSQGEPVFANQTNLLATDHFYLRFEDSINPLPIYFRDSGSEFIRANYLDNDGGTSIESDGSEQAIVLGLPDSSDGSYLSLDITKSKTSTFLNSMSEAFTIAFRVKVKPTSTTTTRIFWSNDGGFNGRGVKINCTSGGQVQFYIGAESVTPSDNRVITELADTITNNDTYSNWVFTYDRATSTANIYKNGALVKGSSTIVVDNSTKFVVGSVNPQIGNGPDGERFATVFSRFIIAPKVLDATERTQIFA